MINDSSDKPKISEKETNNSIWNKVGSLAFSSLFRPIENMNVGKPLMQESYNVSNSFLEESLEITKERYGIITDSGKKEFKIEAKLKIYKPGNYIIIFYSKMNADHEVRTLNKLYEISHKELYNSFPYEVKLNKNFFKEGQKLLYQKFGEKAEGFATDFSKVGIARIHDKDFSTVEEKFPSTAHKHPVYYNTEFIQ